MPTDPIAAPCASGASFGHAADELTCSTSVTTHALVNGRCRTTTTPSYGVVDLHALTVQTDPEVLRALSRRTAAQFLWGGTLRALDVGAPELRHEHTSCRGSWPATPLGEANRMTQFKVAKG